MVLVSTRGDRVLSEVRHMKLTPRKQAVLKAIVKAYIETGEPVGSKNLTFLLENAPSSATLRNEMSELCELGFLEQPHTSAGRIPTSRGYRFYIESLSAIEEPVAEIKSFIDDSLAGYNCEPENIPVLAAQTLSHLTGLPAISCLITVRPPVIKRIELLSIGRYSAMLLIITDDGRTRSRTFRKSRNFTEELEQQFRLILKKCVVGKQIGELTKAYLQNVIAKAGPYALEFMPLFSIVFEIASEIEETNLKLKGENALYNICGDEISARRVLSLIKQRDPIISILENVGDGVGAIFGADTVYSELEFGTFIAAKFKSADKYKGYIGVIGPNRMSYEQIMPGIEYIAKRLTIIMTEAQRDMED